MLLAESVPRLTEASIDACRAYAGEMEEITRGGPTTAVKWLELDRAFHRSTFDGVEHMRVSMRLVEGYWNIVHHYRLMHARMAGAVELNHFEHRLLLDAIGRRDETDAASFLRSHIRRTRLDVGGHLRAIPLHHNRAREVPPQCRASLGPILDRDAHREPGTHDSEIQSSCAGEWLNSGPGT